MMAHACSSQQKEAEEEGRCIKALCYSDHAMCKHICILYGAPDTESKGHFFPLKLPSSFSLSFNTAVTYVVLRACE